MWQMANLNVANGLLFKYFKIGMFWTKFVDMFEIPYFNLHFFVINLK